MAVHLDVVQAVGEFETLLGRLHVRNLPEFFELVEERIARERQASDHDGVKGAEGGAQAESSNCDVMMHSIAHDLRTHSLLPPDAVVKSERIYHPTTGEFAALDPVTVVSVDKFLYEDDEAIDEMCDEGMLSRNYCLDCGSHHTAPLNFVSHSASLLQLKFMFQKALPDLAGKTVVDIGSRLGPVLYGAYFYSSASRIVGIEINPELCAIQGDIIRKFALRDRIEVINADVCTEAAVLEEADVIIMHNVFEFFAPPEAQVSVWKFLRKTLRKAGSLLVTVPSLEKSMEALQLSMDLPSWVKQLPLDHLSMWMREEEAREEVQLICLYQLL
ncbi:uncharacterized protein LOC110988376 isoform X2 [Acanthaster planci]|uniref:Uncharacterized protein LOC110988376 isoform X2 n=1 Tax=Acanthaster planci TaxID=133434 RepID=A0A8B7ZR10_ACAPL|nr:uncharacterized protein LOC110988376 isoform X2 [Acanthaster planci]